MGLILNYLRIIIIPIYFPLFFFQHTSSFYLFLLFLIIFLVENGFHLNNETWGQKGGEGEGRSKKRKKNTAKKEYQKRKVKYMDID